MVNKNKIFLLLKKKKGEIKKGKCLGEISMKIKDPKEEFIGLFDFDKEVKGKGIGVLEEKGIEYFVEYNEKGELLINSKKRTFEGIRLMIG